MINAFGISVTTFVGQNYGAGKQERVRGGVRSCMGMSALATILMSWVLYYYGVHVYGLFTTDAVVIRIGQDMMRYLVPTYITYITVEIFSGALRGVGDCWVPMIISMLGTCILRCFWMMVAVPMRPDMYNIMFCYPLTWVVTSVSFSIYYLFFSRLKVVGENRKGT